MDTIKIKRQFFVLIINIYQTQIMFGASPFTLLRRKQAKKQPQEKKEKKEQKQKPILNLLQNEKAEFHSDQSDSQSSDSSVCEDLNVFVVTFQKMKQAEKQLSGGDPYQCKHCQAYLNSYSLVIPASQYKPLDNKFELKEHESVWKCEFCSQENILSIQKQQIPKKDDIVYMLESQHENMESEKDQTMVFCIDVSGSMNTTTEIQGKVDLKFGISQQQIQMLKQFMEPGDQAQFNYLPGNHNKNKTFVSRKQCILSAIQSQLQQIRKNDPHKKVSFVTFSNEVTVLGDKQAQNVNIVGDKLYNKNSIVDSLKNFSLKEPIANSYDSLVNNLNKTQAKGQTALGPALISAIQIASKGNPGSSIYLCTDGLSNIGIGALDPLNEQSKKFYSELADLAKQRNLSVNIMTIKGEGSKMQVIGKLAESTHGSMKVLNPQKLAEDFANVLKDEVVGISVKVKIMLHKAMQFRKQSPENIKSDGRVLLKQLPNATKNSKVSFEYQLRNDEELQMLKVDLEQLKKVPFQAQVEYTSTKGGKYLRIITSETKTTVLEEDLKKAANLGVVHQRVTAQTAALYSKGRGKQSVKFNDKWSNFLSNNFRGNKEYEKKQQKFEQKNVRLKKAIKHKAKKNAVAIKEEKQEEDIGGLNLSRQNSLVDSDSDEVELMDNLMEKQNYSFCKQDSDSD